MTNTKIICAIEKEYERKYIRANLVDSPLKDSEIARLLFKLAISIDSFKLVEGTFVEYTVLVKHVKAPEEVVTTYYFDTKSEDLKRSFNKLDMSEFFAVLYRLCSGFKTESYKLCEF